MAVRKTKRIITPGEKEWLDKKQAEINKVASSNEDVQIPKKDNQLLEDDSEWDLSYLQDKFIPSVHIPSSCDVIRRLIGKEEDEGLSILAKAFNEVAGENGREFFAKTLESAGFSLESSKKSLYEASKGFAKETVPSSVIEEVKFLIKISKATDSGFIYDEKKGSYSFNPNLFVRHFVKRITACATKDGRIYLYNPKGYYQEMSEVMLGKIIRQVMNQGCKDSWTSKKESESVKALQRELTITDEMNSSKEFINLQNGMLNLVDFHIYPHDPKYLSTVQLPICYNPKADFPQFQKFIQDITLNDKEMEMVLQEVMGYVLTAETKAEKAFYLFGRGANGKSVLASIMTDLVGKENVSNIPLANFNQDFGLESIINKTVNISMENEMVGNSLKTDNFKAIVSGDRININIKYRSHINYEPFCKLIFLVNTLPDTSDTTEGYFRKILIVPFKRTFRKEEQDVHLKDKLLLELPGILNWALEGLERLRGNNYRFSKCKAIEESEYLYLLEQNPVQSFVDERVGVGRGATRKPDIFPEYLKWLDAQGIDDKGTRSRNIFWKYFNLVLENLGTPIRTVKRNGTDYLDGIQIVNS
ncbi:DNA primase family protein [Bacillus sp. Au-Bac7]|uniref:DNA primase family protein n=1 Tax=Bacillus sp. Au-Bac7 TaxID=2906458 RepID=UPI001E350D97|nr:phage/plasmid primase, P4 family [Bacillus sp. Au-Bac7]MCE4049909.1 phage/plasmid primase, P4 family [Bacillus sp. Au-Bac7]